MLRNYWYIAAAAEEIKKDSFVKKKILNQPILIFKKSDQSFGAIENRCCHRNVELSLGSFKNDCFTCGYHGWTFNSKGECIKIPSLKTDIPKTARIKSFPVVEQHGFVWVCLNPERNPSPPNHFPELADDPFIFTHHQFRGDLRFVSESLFDPYHINHVHKNSIKSLMGDLGDGIIDFNIERKEGVLRGNYLRKNNGSFFEKSYFGTSEYIPTYFEFCFPNISKLEMRFNKRRMTIYEHVMEVEPGILDMIQITTWNNIFSRFTSFAKWFMRQKSERIVREDIDFFVSHARSNEAGKHTDVHVKSDRVSIEFRKLWDEQQTKDANV